MATTGKYAGLFTHNLPPVKMFAVAGGAAGTHTVTGITTDDYLLGVAKINFKTTGSTVSSLTTYVQTVSDLLSEFSISADDTVTNASGTDSTNALLLILYADYDA